jgi:flavodoxin
MEGEKMKTKVISYSFTGNNEALAADFAKEIGAIHLRITEPKKRTMGTILKENLFKKDPKINLSEDEILENDFAVFFSPFWFGKIASPLRSYFKQIKKKCFKYGFISLCVGFEDHDGTEKFKIELTDMLGREPEFVIIKKIADLLPSEPIPTQKLLNDYRVNQDHTKLLVASLKDSIGPILLK